jgi:hypothetical protein
LYSGSLLKQQSVVEMLLHSDIIIASLLKQQSVVEMLLHSDIIIASLLKQQSVVEMLLHSDIIITIPSQSECFSCPLMICATNSKFIVIGLTQRGSYPQSTTLDGGFDPR